MKDLDYYLNLPYEIIIKNLMKKIAEDILQDIKTSLILWEMVKMK